MSWWQYKAGLFPCNAVNRGTLHTFDEILHWRFDNRHEWTMRLHSGKWINGVFDDIETINDLRTRVMTDAEKVYLKGTLQCWQPSCVMTDKSAQQKPQALNPIMCLDFDHLQEWDIESLKQSIFDIINVCYVSLSCSGAGLYALVQIEEPERLKEYAQHCIQIFEKEGVPIDKGKGGNPVQLRYVSYDANPLSRNDPKPLKLPRINAPKVTPKPAKQFTTHNTSGLIKWAVNQVQNAQVGQRFETVRKVAYSMGGHGYGLEEIKQAIKDCSQYQGVESKYLKHAEEGFKAGSLKPITA